MKGCFQPINKVVISLFSIHIILSPYLIRCFFDGQYVV